MASGIKREGVKRTRYFIAYGGPESGLMVRLKDGTSEYVWRSERGSKSALFEYVLVPTSDGGHALVPLKDHELRKAYAGAFGRDQTREVETLAAELRRRGLLGQTGESSSKYRKPTSGFDPISSLTRGRKARDEPLKVLASAKTLADVLATLRRKEAGLAHCFKRDTVRPARSLGDVAHGVDPLTRAEGAVVTSPTSPHVEGLDRHS